MISGGSWVTLFENVKTLVDCHRNGVIENFDLLSTDFSENNSPGGLAGQFV